MSTKIIKDNQSVLDATLEAFGNLEELYTLLADNGLTANSKLSSGQELTVNNDSVGDEDVKNFVILKEISYNNLQGDSNPPIIAGDFGNDMNNDFS